MKRRGSGKTVARTTMQFPLDGLATLQQAAEFLQLCRTTIYNMVKDGELQQVEIRKARRIPWSALHAIATPERNIDDTQ